MDIYEGLLKDLRSLREAQETDDCGLDQFLSPDKVKVASLGDLAGFFRLSNDTLVHKAQKDLWSIKEYKNGSMVIVRLFNSNDNEPLKV